jgi:hypothetical protein
MGPKMTMHADEEEKRIQRRARLQPTRHFRKEAGSSNSASIFSSGRLSRPAFPVQEEGKRISVKERLGKHPTKVPRGAVNTNLIIALFASNRKTKF